MSDSSLDRRSARGAAAVEFALVMPLLVGLVFSTISYGMMLSFRQGISQAAAEGARAAALAPVSVGGQKAKAQAYLAVQAALGPDFTCVADVLRRGGEVVGACAVTVPATCTEAGCAYRVTVAYNYEDHPVAPALPLVPMPDWLRYEASAEGNS